MAEFEDPDFVEEVGDMIIDFMNLRGHPGIDSLALSCAVKKWIRENYHGERVSIKIQRGRRYAAAIKDEFDGTNLDEIMRRYGVSRTTVFRIVAE